MLPQPLKHLLLWLGTPLSALIAVVAPWFRSPGFELVGLTPDWPLIWVVSWSVNRESWQGAVAGLVLGLMQDGLTQTEPTHALGLAVVGFLTSHLQNQRFMKEDFVSIALIVFGMVVVAETTLALQWTVLLALTLPPLDAMVDYGSDVRSIESIWNHHQRITLTSAIITSLWAPAVYLPLNTLWSYQKQSE